MTQARSWSDRRCASRRAGAAAVVAIAAVIVSGLAVGERSASVGAEGGSFVSLVPARVLDTRAQGAKVGSPDGSGDSVEVSLHGRGGLPRSRLAAVALNVTVVDPDHAGFVTVYPCGRRPDVSNLNFVAGQTVPNAVVTPVSAGGRVCLYSYGVTHLLVDVSGYFPEGGDFEPVRPARIADTRDPTGQTVDGVAAGGGALVADGELRVTVGGRAGVAPDASAVALNVTVVDAGGDGYVTVHPCGARPDASNLNFVTGQTVPNAVLAPLSPSGEVCVYSDQSTDVLVDVAGYFRAGSEFTTVTPTRLLDTRSLGFPIGSPDGSADAFPLFLGDTPVRGASAVALNVTVVDAWNDGYVTVHPCGARPEASNLNFVAGQTVPNAVLAPVAADGWVCFYAHGVVHLLVDASGYVPGPPTWWGPDPVGPSPADPPIGATPPTTTVPSRPVVIPPAGAFAELGTFELMSEPVPSFYRRSPWSDAQTTLLYRTHGGGIGLAVVDRDDKTVRVMRFDRPDFSGARPPVTLSYAGWDVFGGMYATPAGELYLLVGRHNPSQDDLRNVIAVRRYGTDLRLVGTAHVRGGVSHGWLKGVVSPFQASAADMLLVDDRLVVHLGRTMYRGFDGLNHQSNLTVEVDVASMTATPFATLGAHSYVSHSFRQVLASDGSSLFLADHGDAYPRSLVVAVMDDYPTERSVQRHDLFVFNGEIGDNFTGATVTDMVAGPSGVIVAGSSIRHPGAPSGTLGPDSERRNAYLATLDPGTGATGLRWLTNFSATGSVEAGEPRVVQLSPDRFAVLFAVTGQTGPRTEYRLVDGSGTTLASRTFRDVLFDPSSRPVLIGDEIVWVGWQYVWEREHVLFGFALDVSDPERPTSAPA